MRDQPGSAHIPIIIGTYAKMLRKGSNDSDLNLFQWTVLIHLDERPRCDLSHYLERVDFTLHKSFANPVRRCSQPPFSVTAEGWGEFPILVDIVIRGGGSVKLTHYLKLDSPEAFVVNETYETLILQEDSPVICGVPDLPEHIEVPVVDAYFASVHKPTYSSVEDSFITENLLIINRLALSVDELLKRAIEKDAELYAVLNTQDI